MRLKSINLSMRDKMDSNMRIKKGAEKLVITEEIALELYNKYSKVKTINGYSSAAGAVRSQEFNVHYASKEVKITPFMDKYLQIQISKKISKNLYSNDYIYEYMEVIR